MVCTVTVTGEIGSGVWYRVPLSAPLSQGTPSPLPLGRDGLPGKSCLIDQALVDLSWIFLHSTLIPPICIFIAITCRFTPPAECTEPFRLVRAGSLPFLTTTLVFCLRGDVAATGNSFRCGGGRWWWCGFHS